MMTLNRIWPLCLLGIGLLLILTDSASAQSRRDMTPPPNQAVDEDAMNMDQPGSRGPDREGPQGERPLGPTNHMGPPGRGEPPGPPPDGAFEDLSLIKKSNPQLYKLLNRERELDRGIRSAVMKYRRASSDQRSALKEDLKKRVTEQFAVSQQRREEELKWREEKKQQIIDRRVAELVSSRSMAQRGDDRRGPRQPGMGPPGFDDVPPRP